MTADPAAVLSFDPTEPAELLAIVAVVAARAGRLLAWHGDNAGDGAASQRARRSWCDHSEAGRSHTAAIAAAEARLSGLDGSRLARLERLFGLSPRETQLLMTCVAPQVEPALAQQFERLQNRPWPTEALAGELFDWGRAPLWNSGCPLALWGLVSEGRPIPGEPPPLIADPAVRFWLSGQFAVDAELRPRVKRIEPRTPLAGWPVGPTAAAARQLIDAGHPVRLIVEGLPGAGRTTFAASVAKALGLSTFAISPEPGLAEPTPEMWVRAQRAALVAGAALVWHGAWAAAPWPHIVRPAPLHALAVDPGTLARSDARFVEHRIVLPALTHRERERLLGDLVPAAAAWQPGERESLINRRTLTVGSLERLGRHRPETWRAACAALNVQQADVFGDLAHRLEATFTWDDLVLPESLKESLRDLAHECRTRFDFWSSDGVRRLFGRETGLACLFAGPPGVGKSMCAQVMAADLGYELFRIDCATVTSKYVGETSKNLRGIFRRARSMDAVLFFDEAEALFSPRTEVRDAHDRYANADTAYLLQLIESDFDGIAILATNRKGDIDPAFMRRIRHIFDFPRPGPAERLRLWRLSAEALVRGGAGGPLEPVWEVLAESVEMTGAQIKAAMMSAYFAASRRGAPIGIADIVAGLDRELGKEGRSINAEERRRLARHG
jgi:hypothetical protein